MRERAVGEGVLVGGDDLAAADVRLLTRVGARTEPRLATQARRSDVQDVVARLCFFDEEDRVRHGHRAVELYLFVWRKSVDDREGALHDRMSEAAYLNLDFAFPARLFAVGAIGPALHEVPRARVTSELDVRSYSRFLCDGEIRPWFQGRRGAS